jgi:hypothetical protein
MSATRVSSTRSPSCPDARLAAYWKPTAAGYFGRISKERIVQAVREGVSEDAARRSTTTVHPRACGDRWCDSKPTHVRADPRGKDVWISIVAGQGEMQLISQSAFPLTVWDSWASQR